MEIIASQRPYRSKFYSLVVDTSRRNSQIDNKTAILQRQMNFADYVRKNFVPKIDEAKQEQIEGLIRRITS
jgi:G3E family GTPase